MITGQIRFLVQPTEVQMAALFFGRLFEFHGALIAGSPPRRFRRIAHGLPWLGQTAM